MGWNYTALIAQMVIKNFSDNVKILDGILAVPSRIKMEVKKVRVKFLAVNMKRYNGIDPETNQSVQLEAGNVVEVSESKANQLKADFPADFEIVEKKNGISVSEQQPDTERTGKTAKGKKK